MKVRKSNFWTVLSNVVGYVGVGLGLIVCISGAWLKLSGYEIKLPTSFANGTVGGWTAVRWRHFLYAGALIAAVILVAVIFRLIGKAVYKKRLKRALEAARRDANSGYGGLLAGYNMDPETQEKVVDTAKKAVPIVAGVVLACVAVKAIKRSQARKRMEEMRAARYYYY